MFHNFDLFRASSTCLEACWILRTPSWDVPSGYLTLVSFTVEVQVQLILAANIRILSADAQAWQTKPVVACLFQPSRLQAPEKNIQYQSSAVCEPCESFHFSEKYTFKCLDKKEKFQMICNTIQLFSYRNNIRKFDLCWEILIVCVKEEFLLCISSNILQLWHTNRTCFLPQHVCSCVSSWNNIASALRSISMCIVPDTGLHRERFHCAIYKNTLLKISINQCWC